VGGFRAARGGKVVASFDAVDVTLIGRLLDELLDLLDDGAEDGADTDPLAVAVGIGTATRRSDDPVLARLFPDGYRDDDEAAAEFRRYTEVGLREAKRANARTVAETLAGGPARKLPLDDAQAQAWLTTLNDLRLAVGTRLGVTDDWDQEAAALEEDDPRLYAFAVYDHLTFLQESLVQALMAGR
jgi:hypothetical protein